MIAEQQDLHKAIKVLKDGLQIDPSSIALHSVIAEYYRRTGQIQERQRHLDLIESIRYSMERDQ
jgi:Tfp pilus assembly protein PilF